MVSSALQRADDIDITFKIDETCIRLNLEGNAKCLVLIDGALNISDYKLCIVTDNHLQIILPFNEDAVLDLFQQLQGLNLINGAKLQSLQQEITTKFPTTASQPPVESKEGSVFFLERTLFGGKISSSIKITLDVDQGIVFLEGPRNRINLIRDRLCSSLSPYVLQKNDDKTAVTSLCISAIKSKKSETGQRPLKGKSEVRKLFNFLGNTLLTETEINNLQPVTTLITKPAAKML